MIYLKYPYDLLQVGWSNTKFSFWFMYSLGSLHWNKRGRWWGISLGFGPRKEWEYPKWHWEWEWQFESEYERFNRGRI